MARRPRSARGWLYYAARTMGNVDAARRGPAAYGRRVARRTAYRAVNRATGRFLRGMGL